MRFRDLFWRYTWRRLLLLPLVILVLRPFGIWLLEPVPLWVIVAVFSAFSVWAVYYIARGTWRARGKSIKRYFANRSY